MTKVEAIKKVMQANGGQATLEDIYKQSVRYYKKVRQSSEWKAGLRGTLYREVRNARNFKKIDDATYALR